MDMIVPTEGLILQGLDPGRLPSPCTVIDLAALRRNAAVLARVRREAEVRVLAALKAFATWKLFPVLAAELDGACASGACEARLAREHFGGEVHAYSPGFSAVDLADCLQTCDHLVFNSAAQWQRFREPCLASGKICGLRINPEYAEVATALYNPCAAGSRLGIRRPELDAMDLSGISGLHFHTMCEQGPDVLERTLAVVEERFGDYFDRISWLNCGGGHHITNPGYDIEYLIRVLRAFRSRHPHLQVYLEPGEALAIGAGALVGSVCDIVDNQGAIAVLDVSVTAHMPDVLEMPYRPDVWGGGPVGDVGHRYRLAGNTCLAGDVIGDYVFTRPLTVGDRIVFGDMAHYTTVKTSMFNGVRLPDLASWDIETGELRILRRFGYEDYRDRLS